MDWATPLVPQYQGAARVQGRGGETAAAGGAAACRSGLGSGVRSCFGVEQTGWRPALGCAARVMLLVLLALLLVLCSSVKQWQQHASRGHSCCSSVASPQMGKRGVPECST